ncbi:uncharacterized protein L201_001735 [Kwoniella dendrophila CBS 6074]|uniref:Histone deacetylase complex subunit n=1 Tax=Kwoniella dendrophila CBS 6074 TaxID=1295534 RepID=A0AAX4JP52_9TREE
MPRSPSPSRSRSYSRSRSRSPIRRRRSETPEEEAISPFLIRIYVTKGKHVPLIEFDEGNIPLRDEFQVYGWKSSTPSSLIRSLLPSFPPPYRSPLARYSFRHIFVDASARGLYKSKDLVSFTGRDLFASTSTSNSSKIDVDVEQNKMDIDLDEIDRNNNASTSRSKSRKIDEKSLDDYGFVTGDLISVSLYIPEPKLPAGGGPSNSSSSRNPRGSDREQPGSNGRDGGLNGIQSFGWGDRDKAPHGHHQKKEEQHWHRGQPLPPQDFRGGGPRGGDPSRDRGGGRNGGFEGGEPANGGSRRGGAAGGGSGLGIRGQGRRSSISNRRQSPDYDNGRRGDRDRNGDSGRRSRSPESRDRRESWSKRR